MHHLATSAGRRAATLITLALVAATAAASCTTGLDDEHDEGPLGTVSQAVTSDECVELPSTGTISVTWLNIPATSALTASTIQLRLRNDASTSQTITPSILAEGLDQRRREKVLPAVTVPAQSFRDVNVRLSSDLPVQSTTFSTQMHARITYERANQPDTFFLSSPVYVHSNSSYSVFTVYNESVMRDQFGGGQLTTDASDLQGRVLTDGVWQDIGVLRRLEWIEEGGSGLPPLINGHWWGDFTTMPTPESFNPCSGGSCDAVCAVAQNAYVDGGGDYGSFGAPPSCPECLDGDFELGFARARITRQTTPKCENTSPSPSQNPCIQVVWDGYLDEAGCAQAALDQNGSYDLWIFGEAAKSTIPAASFTFEEYDDDNQPIGATNEVRIVRSGFAWPYAATTGTIMPVPGTKFTYALANVSRVLATDLMKHNTSMKVFVNRADTFYGGALANYAADSVFTGPWTKDNFVGGLQYRNVVTHEIGHIIQDLRFGPLRNIYNDVAGNNYCSCAKVVSSNGAHCLQSGETASVGQVEGFGHYIASRVWNDPTESDCAFEYYKEFWDPATTLVFDPPHAVSCANPVRWRNNNCNTEPGFENWGTEYDWMQFYYRITSTTFLGSDALSNADLDEVYKQTCGLITAPSYCTTGIEVEYVDLAKVVDYQFNPNNNPLTAAQSQSFLDEATNTGVNYTTTP